MEGIKHHIITQDALDQFTGSGEFYRHPVIKRILWTEGVQYLVANAECFWLVDEIVFRQVHWPVRREKFQAWKLTVNNDSSAVLTCETGNGDRVHLHKIDYTEFPMKEVRLWLSGNVLMLPTEY
jgi:hypothetical protein